MVKMILVVLYCVGDGGCNVDRGGGHKDGAAGDVKDDKGWSRVIKDDQR